MNIDRQANLIVWYQTPSHNLMFT